ncbi:cytochrome c oxidase subunit II [Haloplanus aerogenes]|uniref:cytochrome-c oxidase n=1 Tax=Haloplanus aerogenes TaxID=660522 RepID=A0A3G8QV35_9EURY|nr:cytochrome c oxidase subunit II [Haloplanus aerogenes]AZH25249.1 cytochrome c oxidase subunit II [Haloplanus aerogenes]RMB24936.1 cytochrome c oxidase subunit 2 [Haloplanus aerogenes]
MKRSRLVLASLLSAVVLSLAADPVVAQPSESAELIYGLNEKLLLVAVPITLLVEGILIYTVYRFKDADEAKPTKENRRLEITWTVATAIILLFVGIASYGVLANENVTFEQDEQQIAPEDDDVVVHMDAFQWGWQASYPQEDVQIASTSPTVVIPAGQDVYFNVTSSDVLHAFHVPKLGLKQDAMPGQSNVIKTVATEEGTYQGYCAEFCGVAHSQMYFEIQVVSQEEYQQYLEEQQSGSSGDLEEPDDDVIRAHDETLSQAPIRA